MSSDQSSSARRYHRFEASTSARGLPSDGDQIWFLAARHRSERVAKAKGLDLERSTLATDVGRHEAIGEPRKNVQVRDEVELAELKAAPPWS